MKTTLFSVRLLSVALLSAGLFASCKKDSNNPSPNNPVPGTGKNVKLTVRVTGYNDAESDYISFTVAGGKVNASSTTWKVNGVTRENEDGIGMGKDELGGGQTIVIESIKPVDIAIAGYQFINFGAPMSIYYKAEIDGKVVNEDSQTLGDDKQAAKRYSY